MSEELIYSGDKAFPDCPPMFPIPDRRGGHADLNCYIFLIQSKFNSSLPQATTESDWLFGEFFK